MDSAATWPAITSPEVELVQLMHAGDLRAVARLYDLYAERVRSFGCRLLANESAADDLVQDVFLALPRAMTRYRAAGTIESFLLGIAARQARRHIRSAMRRRRALERLAEQPTNRDIWQGEREEGARDLMRRCMTGLERLPLKQRLVLVLCDVEGRTAVEVAEIVDAPAATVRARLFHARKKLREQLGERGGQP